MYTLAEAGGVCVATPVRAGLCTLAQPGPPSVRVIVSTASQIVQKSDDIHAQVPGNAPYRPVEAELFHINTINVY